HRLPGMTPGGEPFSPLCRSARRERLGCRMPTGEFAPRALEAPAFPFAMQRLAAESLGDFSGLQNLCTFARDSGRAPEELRAEAVRLRARAEGGCHMRRNRIRNCATVRLCVHMSTVANRDARVDGA